MSAKGFFFILGLTLVTIGLCAYIQLMVSESQVVPFLVGTGFVAAGVGVMMAAKRSNGSQKRLKLCLEDHTITSSHTPQRWQYNAKTRCIVFHQKGGPPPMLRPEALRIAWSDILEAHWIDLDTIIPDQPGDGESPGFSMDSPLGSVLKQATDAWTLALVGKEGRVLLIVQGTLFFKPRQAQEGFKAALDARPVIVQHHV